MVGVRPAGRGRARVLTVLAGGSGSCAVKPLCLKQYSAMSSSECMSKALTLDGERDPSSYQWFSAEERPVDSRKSSGWNRGVVFPWRATSRRLAASLLRGLSRRRFRGGGISLMCSFKWFTRRHTGTDS